MASPSGDQLGKALIEPLAVAARAFEPSATPSLVVHERPSREGSSRRHVGGHVRDQRRARARSMRVEIRAKCANNLYQRTFQSISPSVHELAFEDVSRVDINQRRAPV